MLQLQFRDIVLEWGKEDYYRALLTLRDVREIRRFDEPVAQLTLEGDGSDVLQFWRGEGTALLLIEWHYYQQTALLLIEWHYYQQKAHVFAKYEIDYATFSITVEKQSSLID